MADYRFQEESGPWSRDRLTRTIFTSLIPTVVLAALVGLFLGRQYSLQISSFQSQLSLSEQAIGQYDEILDIVGEFADGVQRDLEAVFAANDLKPEAELFPKKDMQKADGAVQVQDRAKAESPSPSSPLVTPETATPPPLRGVEQLRSAYAQIKAIQENLNVEVPVPSYDELSFNLISEAEAARKTHQKPVPSSTKTQGLAPAAIALFSLIGFLLVLMIFVLWLHSRTASPTKEELYGKIASSLANTLGWLTVSLMTAVWGVKYLAPT